MGTGGIILLPHPSSLRFNRRSASKWIRLPNTSTQLQLVQSATNILLNGAFFHCYKGCSKVLLSLYFQRWGREPLSIFVYIYICTYMKCTLNMLIFDTFVISTLSNAIHRVCCQGSWVQPICIKLHGDMNSEEVTSKSQINSGVISSVKFIRKVLVELSSQASRACDMMRWFTSALQGMSKVVKIPSGRKARANNSGLPWSL